ncbi:MIZ1 [Mytilus edulis]|uniref:ZBTB17 n=1 Tax=Mytilus edulis TaxID=6550 RepID=A0A8S3ST30_MYTED|nr:MIZ1 [Mytilus edulis]
MLFNLRVSSTVQADDIALISTTSKGMKTLIDICQTYSENWGFRFSSAKSEVLKFCSSKCATISQPLKLYGADIPVVISTKHVGILLNAEFKSMSRTLNACRILRATALSVMKSGIHPSFLNPLTCSKIVFQMCYPKAMFACELWYGLSNTELTMLERSHKYICKTIQGLPARTRSDKCTSLLGWLPVECYIDKCKLQFFGRLCRMDNNLLPKRILLLRLLEFRNKCAKKQDGFVPDLIKIAVKYDLINFVEDFVKSGSFPSKTVWNRYISTSIANSENNRWQQRISVDSDFEVFRKIHKHIVPHRAWVIAKTNPNFREGAKYIVDLCSVIRSEESPLLCDKCGQFFYNIIEHIMCMCDRLSDLRAKLWEDLISINPIVFSVYLDNLTSSTFTATLLSCYTEYDLDNDNSIYFSKTCITHVQRMCSVFYNS